MISSQGSLVLSPAAALALELAHRADGYLVANDAVINALRREGLIMTQNVGDGFVIAKAIRKPQPRYMNHGYRWPGEARVTP